MRTLGDDVEILVLSLCLRFGPHTHTRTHAPNQHAPRSESRNVLYNVYKAFFLVYLHTPEYADITDQDNVAARPDTSLL